MSITDLVPTAELVIGSAYKSENVISRSLKAESEALPF